MEGNTTLAGSRDIGVVEAEIHFYLGQFIINSIEIGRRLCEVKERLDHGVFGLWLKEKFDFSHSTANTYMRLYQEYGDEQGSLFGASVKSQTFAKLGHSKLVALLALPAAEREAFVEEHDVESASVRDLKYMLETREREAKALLEKRDAENAALKDQVDAAQKEIRDAVAREKQAAAEAKKQAVQKKNEEIARLKASLSLAQSSQAEAKKATPEAGGTPGPEIEVLRAQLETANAERDALKKQVKASGRELTQAQVYIDAMMHSANKYLEIVKTMRAGGYDDQTRAAALTQAMTQALETIGEQLAQLTTNNEQ